MKIEKALESDLPKINSMIKGEFPYLERSTEVLQRRIENNDIVIFKATEGNQILGFIELEFIAPSIARINGLVVEELARGIGVGKKLLEHAIEFLKGRDIARILLLVKHSNQNAKALYESSGFKFIGLYQSKINNAVVEEMELDLGNGVPSYVS